MRINKASILAASALTLLAAGAIRAQGAGKTVWDGVYTEAQDARGADAYAQNCGSCHGVTLTGTGEAPGLTGGEWLGNWNGLSVGELYDRIRTTMPFDKPGSLSREAYADVVAHILKSNGFPAGQAELDKRSEVLATIKIAAQRPAGTPAAAAPAPAAPTAAAPQTAPAASAAVQPKPAPVTPIASNKQLAGANTPNSQPNPYRTTKDFFKVPAGQSIGSTSGVAVDSKGNVWVAGRCGANSCATSQAAPIMMFDSGGNFVRGFGAGLFNFPHGLFIDRADNLWVVDERVEGGKGGTITKFSPDGKVLLTLGKAGVAGGSPETFSEPNAVVVAPNGTIFVAEGHTPDKAERIVKFDATGKFLKQWGTAGTGPGQLNVPHTLAMDSKGRLYVGDRWNNRIQIFDQDGKVLGELTQFGRPSGIYIDAKDVLYVADSESRAPVGYGYNPGWKRGIRIGNLSDGVVRAFIPDLEPEPDKGATSGAEGIWVDKVGNIYGAQVKERSVFRYTK